MQSSTDLSTKPLRKCRQCGFTAYEVSELEKFTKNKNSKHGRDNLCRQCFNENTRSGGKYFSRKQEYNQGYRLEHREEIREKGRVYSSNSIWFKGDHMYFPFNPRKNICSICGLKHPQQLPQQTAMHHIKYDRENPLDYTLELCHSCHIKIHKGSLKIEYEIKEDSSIKLLTVS